MFNVPLINSLRTLRMVAARVSQFV
jgi:hypothetical protein